MRFKVDENLPEEIVGLLVASGHDAMSVTQQGMTGAPDGRLAKVCLAEARAIITLDLDFADVRVYPPAEAAGIVVLRLRTQDKPRAIAVIEKLLPLFGVERLVGRLWIVDEAAVRIRGED